VLGQAGAVESAETFEKACKIGIFCG